MVPADDDGRRDLALPDQVVQAQAHLGASCALSDDNLAAGFPGVNELGKRFRRILKIAIHQNDGIAPGGAQAGGKRGLVSPIA